MSILNAFVRLIAHSSTPSQHVMRMFTILATQDCIIEGRFLPAGKGYQVSFDDIRAKLSTYAPTLLRPVKGTNNTYCYAQAFSWNHLPNKSLDQRCTEYANANQSTKASLEKDWVNAFGRSVLRSEVMKGLFLQDKNSYFVEDDMKRCLDTLRVPIRSYFVTQIASNLISWSANFLGQQGPRAARMGSTTTASGVVWNAIGLGKSAPRGTGFAKSILQTHLQVIDCVYCGTTLNSSYPIDHIMCFNHGGYSCHHAGNLIPACDTCNGTNGKGSKYLGLDAWIKIKDFYCNNPAIVDAVKLNMTSISSRRHINWQDWWGEIIAFYSNHLNGTVVWSPRTPLAQLNKKDLIAIRQVLNSIKQL